MNDASLSTVVVLVIVVIVIAAWLPARTARSMRHVEEHREDRFSPALHLVDAGSGTRFSDTRTPQAKGIIMQPEERRTPTLSPARIARVRHLRRQAIRRRRIVVLVLAAIVVLVLALAFGLHFSPLYALIPAALLGTVLALGARASAQARAWERRVAEQRRRRPSAARPRPAAVRGDAHAPSAALAAGGRTADEAETETLAQREIRRVLRDAAREQARREALRAEAEERARAAESRQSEPSAPADAPVPDGRESADARAAAASVVADASAASAASRAEAERSQTARPSADAPVSDASRADARDSRDGHEARDARDARDARNSGALVPTDETAEVGRVRPAPAMDAFDMAVAPLPQDLISFSLGTPRTPVEEPEAPESLEIASTRQVSHAVPPEEGRRRKLAEQGRAVAASDAASFHESEEHADVEAPAATSDSLGGGLESILARRVV